MVHFESDFYAQLQPSLNEPLPDNSIVVAAAVKCTVSLFLLCSCVCLPPLAFIRPLAGPPCFCAEKGRFSQSNQRIAFQPNAGKMDDFPDAHLQPATSGASLMPCHAKTDNRKSNSPRQVQAQIQSATPIRAGKSHQVHPVVIRRSLLSRLLCRSRQTDGLQETCLSADPLHQPTK